jgi:DNA primase catalytic subunit
MRRGPLITLEAKASLFDQIILYERVDVALLDRLISQSPGWLLPRYRKAVVEGRVPVEYRKKAFGRAIVTGSVGLHNIERGARHALARAHFVDWDMKNAHPTILLQVCEAHQIGCTVLRAYVCEREATLGEVVAHYGVSKEAAKVLFLRMIFGGGFAGWIRENRVPHEKSEMTERLRSFSQEMANIALRITERNPAIMAYLRERQDGNFEARVLATFLQEMECRILESLFAHCVESGLIQESVAVLCNDGFMLEAHLSRPELAEVFTRHTLAEHGFLLEFATKSMEEVPTMEVERPSPPQADLYKFYLRNLYPARSVYRMLCMEGVLPTDMAGAESYRRLAFVAKNGAYWRDPEGRIRDRDAFERELLSRNPAQLHFDELRHQSTSLRELVFDIDATSFKRYCECGKEKKVCHLCWLHIEGASLVLHHLLVKRLGIPEGHLLWVVSGMKGFHCLVNERRLLYLTNPQRKSLLNLMRRTTSAELRDFGLSLDPDFALLLHERFEALCVVGRRLLINEAFKAHCLGLLATDYPDLHSVVRERWAQSTDSAERWGVLKELQQYSRTKGVSATLLIILHAYYPVIDEGPMRCGTHLFKLPFSVHSQTRRLALPVRVEELSQPSPPAIPTLESLCEYFRLHQGEVHPRFLAGHDLFQAWLPIIS